MDLEKDKMDTLKQLAEVNIEISNAKAILQNLKSNIQDFLEKRKLLEEDTIRKVYSESKGIIDEIQKEFSKIHAYYNEIRSYTVFLQELQSNIISQIDVFTENSEEFIQYIQGEFTKISELKKDLENDRIINKNEFDSIQKAKVQLSKDRKHLESQQDTLATSFKEIKKLWKQQKQN